MKRDDIQDLAATLISKFPDLGAVRGMAVAIEVYQWQKLKEGRQKPTAMNGEAAADEREAISAMTLFWRLYEGAFYWLEKQAGKLWGWFLPNGRAVYWLDFLPAFCLRERYRGQNNRMRHERRTEWRRGL